MVSFEDGEDDDGEDEGCRLLTARRLRPAVHPTVKLHFHSVSKSALAQSAPHTADTVHGDGSDWVVDLDLVEEQDGEDDDHTGDHRQHRLT